MKKILAAAAMLAVMAGSASAQGGGRMQMSPEQMAQMMATRVDAIFKGVTVTDAVKKEATDILMKAQTDGRAIDRQAADRQEQMKKINDKRNDDLVALVSSAADKKTVTDNIAALPQGRGNRPPPTR